MSVPQKLQAQSPARWRGMHARARAEFTNKISNLSASNVQLPASKSRAAMRGIRRSACAAALLLAALFPARAIADTVIVLPPDSLPSTAPTTYHDVRIISIANGKIIFRTQADTLVTKDLNSVIDMTINDEPAFNDALHDIAANHLDKAIDDLDRVMAKTDKSWLKDVCQVRMLDVADRAGRFDKAADSYIVVVNASASPANVKRPAIPQFGSNYLDSAAKSVTAAVNDKSIKPEQLSTLLVFLMDIHRARHDDKGMEAVGQRLSNGGVPAGPTADVAVNGLADACLLKATAAINRKDFAQAIQLIESSRQLFVESTRQADALYVVAQARDGIALDSNAPDDLRDAAIAYLRVVADFKTTAAKPHVADSLLHAALILEKLDQRDRALELDQSILNDFPRTGAAQAAAEQAKRLKTVN